MVPGCDQCSASSRFQCIIMSTRCLESILSEIMLRYIIQPSKLGHICARMDALQYASTCASNLDSIDGPPSDPSTLKASGLHGMRPTSAACLSLLVHPIPSPRNRMRTNHAPSRSRTPISRVARHTLLLEKPERLSRYPPCRPRAWLQEVGVMKRQPVHRDVAGRPEPQKASAAGQEHGHAVSRQSSRSALSSTSHAIRTRRPAPKGVDAADGGPAAGRRFSRSRSSKLRMAQKAKLEQRRGI